MKFSRTFYDTHERMTKQSGDSGSLYLQQQLLTTRKNNMLDLVSVTIKLRDRHASVGCNSIVFERTPAENHIALSIIQVLVDLFKQVMSRGYTTSFKYVRV